MAVCHKRALFSSYRSQTDCGIVYALSRKLINYIMKITHENVLLAGEIEMRETLKKLLLFTVSNPKTPINIVTNLFPSPKRGALVLKQLHNEFEVNQYFESLTSDPILDLKKEALSKYTVGQLEQLRDNIIPIAEKTQIGIVITSNSPSGTVIDLIGATKTEITEAFTRLMREGNVTILE
ncbi:MAG: hypothetical protein ACJAY8_000285 [Sphingobacteriales bacterium]|jgi:hypothetical protein